MLSDAIGKAFKDLVLPFHSGTIQNLQVGDILRHTAGANLQLGLGASIGFSSFSVAKQYSGHSGPGQVSQTDRRTQPHGTPGRISPTASVMRAPSSRRCGESRDLGAAAPLQVDQKTQGLRLTTGIP